VRRNGHREAWDKKYVEVEDEDLFELILAANFLGMKDLLDLTCNKVSHYFPDFSFAEICCLGGTCILGIIFAWYSFVESPGA
jgi:hypothetical protein